MRTGFGMVLRGPEVSVVEGGGKGIETEGPMGEVRLGSWRRALWAVFFREFMPQLPIAASLPVICAVVVGLVGMLKYVSWFTWNGWSSETILLNPASREFTIVGAPLIGLFLGVMQARRDMAADIWSFMVHHPVRRGVLFAGRVLAGWALYGIAAGVPLVVLFVYAAWETPFHWRWTLPTVADGLSGLVYYFAGLLVVQREGFLLGSRLLPVLVAAGCSAVMAAVPAFWEAVGVVVLCVGVFAAAAMGASYSNGYRLRSPRMGRWATHLILFAGLAILFLGGTLWGHWANNFYSKEAIRELTVASDDDMVLKFTSYYLLPDGTLGLKTDVRPSKEERKTPTYDPSADSSTYERVWPVKEPISREIFINDTEEVRRSKVRDFYEIRFPYSVPYSQLRSRQVGQVFKPIVTSATEPSATQGHAVVSEEWYYVSPPGLFLGYDHATHRYLGSIGVDGFAPPGKHAQPFGIDAYNFVVFGEKESLLTMRQGEYRVNWENRTAIPGMRFPATGAVMFLRSEQNSQLTHLVLTHDRMEVYPPDATTPTTTMPLALSPDTHYIFVKWFVEQHRWALLYRPRPTESDIQGGKLNVYNLNNVVEFFDETGVRLAHIDVPEWNHVEWREGHPPLPPVPTIEQAAVMRGALRVSGFLQSTGGLSWSLLGDYLIKDAVALTYDGIGNTPLPWSVRYFVESFWWAAGLTLIPVAGGMWLVARRYQVRRRWVWVVGAVIFGPMMMFLLVSIKVLPRRVRCGVCGKGTFTNRAACGSCGTAFDEPGRNGTEIFGGRQ